MVKEKNLRFWPYRLTGSPPLKFGLPPEIDFFEVSDDLEQEEISFLVQNVSF